MGNQHSNGNQGSGQLNAAPKGSINKQPGGLEGAGAEAGAFSFPDLTTKPKSPVMKKKKEKSPKKKNRSMTPTKQSVSQKGVSFSELNDPKEINRALTPLRQISGRKESDPGLDTLAIGLIRSQSAKKKLSLIEITNINKTIKFVEFHQTLLPESQDSVNLHGGPLLGYDLSAISEMAPGNDLNTGRMSFSTDPTDFKQKYKLRTEIYRNAVHTVKMDELKENPRFIGDRNRAILSREVPKNRELEQEKEFEVEVGVGVGEKEREFSPEFFVPRNSIMSQHNRIDSKTLRKLLKQNTDKDSDGEEEGGAYRRLQGALMRVEQREESRTNKNMQVTTQSKNSSKLPSQPNSRKDSLSQSRSLSSMRKGSSQVTKKPKDLTESNARSSSPGFVVGKPKETKQIKKNIPSTKSQPQKQTPAPASSRRQSDKVVIGSKKQSVANLEGNQNASKILKQGPQKLSIQTRESISPMRAIPDEGKKQPQTARYEKKNFWKEAERPSPPSRESIRKKNEANNNENKELQKNMKELKESLSKGAPKSSSPLAREYINYLNTSSTQSAADKKAPVKVFDLNDRKYSAPQSANNVTRVQTDTVSYVNQTVPAYTTEKDSSYQGVHMTNLSNQYASESREPGDTSDDDDIQPIEATLDLSEFILNTTSNQDQDLRARASQRPQEKGFVHPLLQEKGLTRISERVNINMRIDSNRAIESDYRSQRNTEADSKLMWDPINQEFKKIPIDSRKGSNTPNVGRGKYQEENQDYGDNLQEDIADNNFVNEIKRKMDKITGKIDSIPENRDRANSQAKVDYWMRNQEEKVSKKYYQEAPESKENDAYKINVQPKEYYNQGIAKNINFPQGNMMNDREPSIRMNDFHSNKYQY